MNDATTPKTTDGPGAAPGPKRQRGPKRRTTFGFGVVIGLALGVAGGILVPDLFPEGEPDCVRPEQVIWSQTAEGGVRLEVDYAGDGAGGCDANVVFSEAPTP